MKYREITFGTIAAAILHRWKTLVFTIVAFLALGIVSSVLFADRATAEGTGSAPEWTPVGFEGVTEDLVYYNRCYDELSEQSSALLTYVTTLSQEQTLTGDQAQQLMSLHEEITNYQQEILPEISDALSAPDALYVPTKLRQDAVEEYNWLLDSTRNQIVKAESAMTVLQSVGGLTSTNEEISATYNSLLSQAAQYGQLQLNLEKYEGFLDRLVNDSGRVQADSQAMESMLEQTAESLNALGERCHQAVQEIAQENYLDVTTQGSGEELEVRIQHTARPADRQEAFTALVLLFGLTGICAGAFFALWRECALRKERAHAERPA